MNDSLLTVSNIECTCTACPSQWEGHFEDGSELYIRYRYGILRVCKDDKTIYEEAIGDSLDGLLEENELVFLTKHLIKYPDKFEQRWDI